MNAASWCLWMQNAWLSAIFCLLLPLRKTQSVKNDSSRSKFNFSCPPKKEMENRAEAAAVCAVYDTRVAVWVITLGIILWQTTGVRYSMQSHRQKKKKKMTGCWQSFGIFKVAKTRERDCVQWKCPLVPRFADNEAHVWSVRMLDGMLTATITIRAHFVPACASSHHN